MTANSIASACITCQRALLWLPLCLPTEFLMPCLSLYSGPVPGAMPKPPRHSLITLPLIFRVGETLSCSSIGPRWTSNPWKDFRSDFQLPANWYYTSGLPGICLSGNCPAHRSHRGGFTNDYIVAQPGKQPLGQLFFKPQPFSSLHVYQSHIPPGPPPLDCHSLFCPYFFLLVPTPQFPIQAFCRVTFHFQNGLLQCLLNKSHCKRNFDQRLK